MDKIIKEHISSRYCKEVVFYPDHPPRKESSTFKKTKKEGHAKKIPCAISGVTEKTEYHHFFIEWAFSEAVDWEMVKRIGTEEIKELPVLDLKTDRPTDKTFPVELSLVWVICKLLSLRGFDWEKFDPKKPETLVDSMANMLVLHEKFHRSKSHGIHIMTFPVWVFQAFPRKKEFIFTEDEE